MFRLYLFFFSISMGASVFCPHQAIFNLLNLPYVFYSALFLGVCGCIAFSTHAVWLGGNPSVQIDLIRRVLSVGSKLTLVTIVCLAGFAVGVFNLQKIIQQQMPEELEGKKLALVFRVESLPEKTDTGRRFDVSILSADFASSATAHDDGNLGGSIVNNLAEDRVGSLAGKRVRLSWRNAPNIEAGDAWQAEVRLRRPRGLANPRGFDYQAWLLHKGYAATGYILKSAKPVGLPNKVTVNTTFLDRLKSNRLGEYFTLAVNNIRARIYLSLSQAHDKYSLSQVGLLYALVLGDKSNISAEEWQLFNQTGTVHLLVISGLHIGLIATVFFYLGRWVSACCSWWIYRPLVLQCIPAFFSLLGAGVYAALAGFTIPTQRAFLLVLLVNYINVRQLRCPVFHLLLLVFCLVIFIEPFAFLQQGFWLSFVAVSALIFAFSFQAQSHNQMFIGVSDAIRFTLIRFMTNIFEFVQKCVGVVVKAQWVSFFAMISLLLCFGLPIAILAPIANLVAVPLVSFGVVPFVFMGVFIDAVHHIFQSLIQVLFVWGEDANSVSEAASINSYFVANALLDVVVNWLRFMNQFESHQWWQGQLGSHFLPLGMLAAFCCLSHRVFRLKWLGLCVFTFLFITSTQAPQHQFKVTVLDVGQGLSVVVQKGGEAFVYDVGAYYSSNFDMGSRVLAPFLRSQHIQTVNHLMISHGDNDHAGGLKGLINTVDIDRLWWGGGVSPLNERDGVNSNIQKVSPCIAGDSFTLGRAFTHENEVKRSVTATVLWPDKTTRGSPNNLSCVVLVEYQNFTLLLTGDIEKQAEYRLLQLGRIPRDIDVLVAAHHGSQTSSVSQFVKHASPKHVIFSTGYKNRYHHPNSKVVSRYQKQGAQLWSIADHGAVEITVQGVDSLGKNVNTCDQKTALSGRCTPFLHLTGERLRHPKPWYGPVPFAMAHK